MLNVDLALVGVGR